MEHCDAGGKCQGGGEVLGSRDGRLTSRLQLEGARDRIRVATYHSDLQVFVSRSSVVLNITHVLSFDRMYIASEDVTGALHAATRRLRLKCRSTALESPVTSYTSSPSRSLWDALIRRCTVRRMRNKAKLLYSCATFHKIKSISKNSE
jgi:hypothetical protein